MYMNMYFFGMKYVLHAMCGLGRYKMVSEPEFKGFSYFNSMIPRLKLFYCMLRVPDIVSTIGYKYDKLKEQCVR